MKKQVAVDDEIKNIAQQYIYEHQALSLRAELQKLQNNLSVVDVELAGLIQALDRAIEKEKIENGLIVLYLADAQKLFLKHGQEERLKAWWQKELILKESSITEQQAQDLSKLILFIYREYFADSKNDIPTSLSGVVSDFLPNQDQTFQAYGSKKHLDATKSKELYHWFLLNRAGIEKYYRDNNSDYLTRWQEAIVTTYPTCLANFQSTDRQSKSHASAVTRAFNTAKFDTILIPYEILYAIKNLHRDVKQRLQQLKAVFSRKSEEDLARQAFFEISANIFKIIARVILEKFVQTKEQELPLYKRLRNSLGDLDGSITEQQMHAILVSTCGGLFQFLYELSGDELPQEKFSFRFFWAVYKKTFEAKMAEFSSEPGELIKYLTSLSEAQGGLIQTPTHPVDGVSIQQSQYLPVSSGESLRSTTSIPPLIILENEEVDELIAVNRDDAALHSENNNSMANIFASRPTPSLFSRFINWMKQPWTLFGFFGAKKKSTSDVSVQTKPSFIQLTTSTVDISTANDRSSSVSILREVTIDDPEGIVDTLVRSTYHAAADAWSTSITPFTQQSRKPVEEIAIEEIDDGYISTRTGSADTQENRDNSNAAASGPGGSTGDILSQVNPKLVDTLLPGQVNSTKISRSLSMSRKSEGNASNETIADDYEAARVLGIHGQSTTPPLSGDTSKIDFLQQRSATI